MSGGIATGEAAKVVGISRATLHRWMRTRTVKPPRARLQNGRGVRLWSRADIERLRKIKEQIYRRGRGRQKQQK
ncbi:MAG: helix-turn-helix domain-containing protein [Acidobacteriia bacterium]|nr:helix-turn-helix domain-containing protein [Terriglobia bacterium]